MKRVPNLIVLAAMMSLAIAAVSFAQPPAGNVALAYVQTVDLQKAAAFEEGFKKHLAWRKAQGDTWRWDTWQMVRGEKLGSYYTVSNGHAWKDFDAQPLGPEANEKYMASVGDALLRIDGGMSVALSEFSSFPTEELKNGVLAEVTTFSVKPGRTDDLMQAIGRYHEAVQKVGWDGQFVWIMSVNGGPQTVTLVTPRASWADFKPGDKSPTMILDEAFGRQESIAVSDRFTSSITQITTQVWMYREDLSYIPEKGTSE